MIVGPMIQALSFNLHQAAIIDSIRRFEMSMKTMSLKTMLFRATMSMEGRWLGYCIINHKAIRRQLGSSKQTVTSETLLVVPRWCY